MPYWRQAVVTVPAWRRSMGSGANNAVRCIGSSIGVALTVTLLSSVDGVGPDLALVLAAGFSLAGAAVVFLVAARRR
jgi:hypothetical protein